MCQLASEITVLHAHGLCDIQSNVTQAVLMLLVSYSHNVNAHCLRLKADGTAPYNFTFHDDCERVFDNQD